ncbi:hypothetical protein BD289DRAFT_117240 [Coniella lustricola]|uniref:Uncharacterized protein n=1 Tax=Coniella lustricola TaxID=2025994 RepID=A0A2T2ZWU1_9PEZI|nr:hypothetical protein BD289DRAFT_117240 [Coniella lustricola]
MRKAPAPGPAPALALLTQDLLYVPSLSAFSLFSLPLAPSTSTSHRTPRLASLCANPKPNTHLTSTQPSQLRPAAGTLELRPTLLFGTSRHVTVRLFPCWSDHLLPGTRAHSTSFAFFTCLEPAPVHVHVHVPVPAQAKAKAKPAELSSDHRAVPCLCLALPVPWSVWLWRALVHLFAASSTSQHLVDRALAPSSCRWGPAASPSRLPCTLDPFLRRLT